MRLRVAATAALLSASVALAADWLRRRCKAMVGKNEIKPRRELLIVTDDDGRQVQLRWDPCSSL